MTFLKNKNVFFYNIDFFLFKENTCNKSNNPKTGFAVFKILFDNPFAFCQFKFCEIVKI